MAAPTVGAVMSDLLPYFGVEQNFGPEDASGRLFVMEDLTGMMKKEAQAKLKEQFLTATFVGSGDTVTAQIPAAGTQIAGNSQVLLYMGEEAPQAVVTVPDFSGMNRQQSADAAAKAHLNILVTGNSEISVTVIVTGQSVAAGTEVPPGTTIELQFTDTKAAD